VPQLCLQALSGLPPKHYNCTMEPYVSLDVFKQFWTHRKKQKLYSFKTKCIRHTASPIFRESFVIAGATTKDINVHCILRLTYNRLFFNDPPHLPRPTPAVHSIPSPPYEFTVKLAPIFSTIRKSLLIKHFHYKVSRY
jgi:hypothetical protein